MLFLVKPIIQLVVVLLLCRILLRHGEAIFERPRLLRLFIYGAYALYGICIFLGQPEPPFISASFFTSPLSNGDYTLHFAGAIDGGAFLKNSLKIWGYSPHHFAGYPSGLYIGATNHWAVLLNGLFSGFVPPALIFNLSIAAVFLSLPFLAFRAARNFYLEDKEASVYLLLVVCVICGSPIVRHMFHYGLYGFIFGTCLSILGASYFAAYLLSGRVRALVWASAWGAFAFFVHPFSIVLYAIIALSALCGQRRRLLLSSAGFIISAIAIVTVNLFWIVPSLNFGYLFMGNSAPHLQTRLFTIIRLLTRETAMIIMTPLFASLFFKSPRRDSIVTAAIAIPAVICLILSYIGTQLGVGGIQPLRMVFPLFLFLSLGIASTAVVQIRSKNVTFIVFFALLVVNLVRAPYNISTHIEAYPDVKMLIEFISSRPADGARLHVEDSVYFPSRLTGILPIFTAMETLAGPTARPPTAFAFSQFADGKLFNRPFDEFAAEELKKYLRLYNVRYILCQSLVARIYLESIPGINKIFDTNFHAIYEYSDMVSDLCYAGKAAVVADYNRIRVRGVQGDSLILKYHYIPTLRADPKEVMLSPVYLLDDPVPFIEVKNIKTADFDIYN